MTDTDALQVRKRPCDEGADVADAGHKRQRTQDATVQSVKEVQGHIGEINETYQKQILELQRNLVNELKVQYESRAPLLAALPDFWKQTLRNAFRHYLTDEDHSVLDDLVEIEVDEPFMPQITITLRFSEESPYFESNSVTRSVHCDEEHRSAQVDVDWKETEEAAALREDALNNGGVFYMFACFVRDGDEIENSFDSLLAQVWHDPLPYFQGEMEFPANEDAALYAQDSEYGTEGQEFAEEYEDEDEEAEVADGEEYLEEEDHQEDDEEDDDDAL